MRCGNVVVVELCGPVMGDLYFLCTWTPNNKLRHLKLWLGLAREMLP